MANKVLISTVIKVLISGIVAYEYSGLVASNKDALNLLVNVFAILSGFLFLVITLSANVAHPHSGLTETEKRNQRIRLNQRLARNSFLFIGYLTVLFMVFVYFLISDNKDDLVVKFIKPFFQYAITFCGAFVFLKSLTLPWKMKALTLESIEIERKKLK